MYVFETYFLGVMACPHSYTSDGFELQLGVNHLGHFLLTNLLIDLLKAAAPSRVVVVSSSGHKLSRINKEDLMYEKSYNKYSAYGQSKLANILFAKTLSSKMEGSGVVVNSCHPGVVQTELGKYINKNLRKYFIKPILGPFFKSPTEGAQTQICLAVDPDLENVSGKYFTNCKEKSPTRAAKNEETAEWLWKKSVEIVGLENSFM
jgi:NAD(P)-dependent dehydrogenase (short-subunit alcohol dehydrogenase family)